MTRSYWLAIGFIGFIFWIINACAARPPWRHRHWEQVICPDLWFLLASA